VDARSPTGIKRSRGREEHNVVLALVVSFLVIQVGNKTPILGNYEIFVIHGIPGMIAG
jgi:hypothetical protein